MRAAIFSRDWLVPAKSIKLSTVCLFYGGANFKAGLNYARRASMFYFLTETFWRNPWLVTVFLITMLAIIFLRYVTVAYLYNYIVTVLTKSTVNIYKEKASQIKREIGWSFLSSVVFCVYGGFSYWAYQHGLTKVYDQVLDYSLWYLIFSTISLLLLYETYYYWLHRWMHLPAVYRVVHKVHHQSIHSTVFTSFSFHPLETTLQALFFPVIIFLIPLHYSVLIIVLILMTLSAVINHSGIEVFRNRFLLKHLIGSSHHHLHHTQFKTNFGLYLTWWDKWMTTEAKSTFSNDFQKR
jgi:sterol desaturase/sphingolipid hydroxylase (fatty acid hydroxylase superfamily)